MFDLFSVNFNCIFNLIFQLHHLKVIFELLKFSNVLIVFNRFSFLFEVYLFDPLLEGLSKYSLAVHKVLLLTKDVDISSLEINSFAHGI